MATTKKPATKRAGAEAPADTPYQIQQEQILTDLDPHLQEIVLRQRKGQTQNEVFVSATAVGEELVDVLAKLKDPSQQVPGLNVVGKTGDIISGTVEVSNIESVRTHANVVSLKRATQIGKMLRFSVPEICTDVASLRNAVGVANPAINGAGVIVGVVDFGIDVVHNNFRKADETSRLLFFWDQNSSSNSMSPAPFHYGREFSQADINAALAAADPYTALGFEPADAAHGTHVTDIAAGNGRATGNPGVAPEADIIFVQLKADDTAADDSFGNSRFLFEAVVYIFNKADALNRPCVVNLSLGTHGGPHDGSTLAEQGFDNLSTGKPGRSIVVAAGNSFEYRGHASDLLAPGQTRSLTWQVQPFDTTPNELEVWYPGTGNIDVTLTDPAGNLVSTVAPGNTVTISRQGSPAGRIISRQTDPNNASNQIDIILGVSLPKGNWKVDLINRAAAPVPFDAWIERDDAANGTQSFFAQADVDTTKTLGSISNGHKTIAVGSYDAKVNQKDISSFSAAGPTRDGRQKPEVSAPGQDIRAARSTTQSSTVLSGTSMASPHVAGMVALIMQTAGHPLTCDQIRTLVMNSVRANPPAASAWDARYGVGRVSVAAAVKAALPSGAAAPEHAVTVAFEPPQLAAAAGANGSFQGWLLQILEAAEKSNSKVTLHLEVEPRK